MSALLAQVSPRAPGTIDVSAFVDGQPVGRFQIRLFLMCAAVLFLNGFDTQAIGYVAPDLSRDWRLARGELGPVFSAGLFGLMIGALVFGAIADHIGRKRAIVLTTAAFGFCTLATVFVQDINSLLFVRFLTGLGLGGAMPNAIALTSEFSPHRRRATIVMSMFLGFSVGSALGGLTAAALIPSLGWRSVFVVGGVAPLLLIPLLVLCLPESVRFLALTGYADAHVADLLTRIAPHVRFPPGSNFRLNEAKLAGFPVGHLFREKRWPATLLLWLMFFMSLLCLYHLLNWLPTVVNDLGASVSTAAAIGSMLQVGGVIGTIVLGQFIDRFSFRALALTYLLAAVAIVVIGLSGRSFPFVTLSIFCAGFFLVSSQIAAIALAATYYPTTIRSTGVGWTIGMGRIGSIAGPLIGGMLIASAIDMQSLFLMAALPALAAGMTALALSSVLPDASALVSREC